MDFEGPCPLGRCGLVGPLLPTRKALGWRGAASLLPCCSAPGSRWGGHSGPEKSCSCKGSQLGLCLTLKYGVVCEAWSSWWGGEGGLLFSSLGETLEILTDCEYQLFIMIEHYKLKKQPSLLMKTKAMSCCFQINVHKCSN